MTSYEFLVFEMSIHVPRWYAVIVENSADTTVASLEALAKTPEFLQRVLDTWHKELKEDANQSDTGGSGSWGGARTGDGNEPPGGYDPWSGVSVNVVGTELPTVTIDTLRRVK